MIIVIEGVDETGKTTLAASIAERTGATLLHFGPPADHPLDEYGLPIESLLKGTDLVLDRFHWGELVYGPAYRGVSRLGKAGFAWLEALLTSRQAVTVLMKGKIDRVYDRVVEADDDFVKHDHIHLDELQQTFIGLMENCWTPLHTYNLDIEPPKPDAVSLWAQRYQANTMPLWWRWPNFMGTPDSKMLLVGDRPTHAHHTVPFPPYEGSPGRFLLEAMGLWKAHAWALANVYDRNHKEEDLLGYWLALGCPPVIALGRDAHAALQRQGVPHGTTYHPETMQRLYPQKKKAYGQGIIRVSQTGEDATPWT